MPDGLFEVLRGGFLFMIRWFVHYPMIFMTYRVRNWSRAPFVMDPEIRSSTESPGILVSNYTNYFYDHIFGMMLAPVWPFSFVQDSLYRLPIFKWVFRFFRRIPTVRSADLKYSPEQRKEFNDRSYAAVADRLGKGHWLTVFPEVDAGHRSQIRKPLRSGSAFIALLAESKANWSLNLRIYVYGINYENKFIGRSNVFIRWASPIQVARYQKSYEQDPRAAELELMAEIEQKMHSVVLEADTHAQLEDAYRLAYWRYSGPSGALSLSNVETALNDVLSAQNVFAKTSFKKLFLKRAQGSILYRFLGLVLLLLGWILGWPFRMFGSLCAKDRSQEMSYQFILWGLTLITGLIMSGHHWALVQLILTWVVMKIWLWAWRKGVLD